MSKMGLHDPFGFLKHKLWQKKGRESNCQCRNPSLGFTTKARACKGAGQEGSPGVTSHALRSVGECEGMNPHIPK
jgi:hypothetical protein